MTSFQITKRAAAILFWGCIAATASWGQVSTTQTLSLGFLPSSSLTVTSGTSVRLTASGGFGSFVDTSTSTVLQYSIRTTYSTGSGSITAALPNFTSGSDSIPASTLTYLCSSATVGVPCQGQTTASTISSPVVSSIPAGTCTGSGCSGSASQQVTLSGFSLANTPGIKAGNYTSIMTFTVSAL